MNFKDDELRTSCVYTSTDRVGYTFGGQSSSEEMWWVYLFVLKNESPAKVSLPNLWFHFLSWNHNFLKILKIQLRSWISVSNKLNSTWNSTEVGTTKLVKN